MILAHVYMRNIFYLVTFLVFISGCDEACPGDLSARAAIPADENQACQEYLQNSFSGVKNENDFTYWVYIDAGYQGGDSDGTKERPFTSIDDQFAEGIPANTAFLVREENTRHPSSYTKLDLDNNFLGPYQDEIN
jgi:hypothetical protein